MKRDSSLAIDSSSSNIDIGRTEGNAVGSALTAFGVL